MMLGVIITNANEEIYMSVLNAAVHQNVYNYFLVLESQFLVQESDFLDHSTECRPIIRYHNYTQNGHRQQKGRKLLFGSRPGAKWFEGLGNRRNCGARGGRRRPVKLFVPCVAAAAP